MSTKDFKRGMEAGAKPFNDKFNQVSEAIDKVGKNIDNKMNDLNDVIDVVIDDLSSIRKMELYNLNTKFDINKDLDDTEKELLAALLIGISQNGAENNIYQQRFIRSVNTYMGIISPQITLDASKVENIETLSAQKAILQVIMEYLFLEYGNFDFLEEYEEDFFDYFNVNKKGYNEIKECIVIIYKATGFDGIAEKYGYVANEEEGVPEDSVEVNSFNTYDGNDISDRCADIVNVNKYVALDKYLVYQDINNNIYKVNKKDGSKEIINVESYGTDELLGEGKFLVIKRCFKNEFTIINIESGEINKITIENIWQYSFSNGKIFYITNIDDVSRVSIYNCENKNTNVLEYTEDGINILSFEKFYIYKENIYFNSGYGAKELESKTLYKYNILTGDLKIICKIPENMEWEFLDQGKTYLYNNYLYTITHENKCVYIKLDEETAIRTEMLPSGLYDEIDYFIGYGVIYYVMLNYDFSIHKYDLSTGENKVIIDRTGCGFTGEYRDGIFSKKTFFKVAHEKPQVVGNWLYYRGNESRNILKISKYSENGESQIVNDAK